MLLFLVLRASGALAAVHIEVTAEGGPELRVVVANVGDESAQDVAPEVLYRHRSERQPAVEVAPGERREWYIALDAPPAGALPAVVRVHYRDNGRTATVPTVVALTAPGTPPEAVRGRLDAPAVAGVSHGTLVLENPGSRAVAGRVSYVLPGGLSVDPESMPAEIPSAGRATLPVVLQNEGGLAPGRYPAFAVLAYGDATAPHTVVVRGSVDVGRDDPRRRRPLAIGAAALGVALITLAIAFRRVRR